MLDSVRHDVSVPPDLEKFIAECIASGRYCSVSEVVRDGLRLLQEQENSHGPALTDLRSKINLGLQQIKNGEVHDGEAVFNELMERSRQRRGQSA